MNYFKFDYDGRVRTIRQKTETSYWYLREKIDGKLKSTTFQTCRRTDAERMARDYLRRKRDGSIDKLREVLRIRKPSQCGESSILLQRVIESYQGAAHGPLERTRKENLICLRNIIHQVLGQEPEWTQRPLSDLSKDLVRGYKRLVLEKAARDGDTQAETARRQRTANSTLRQARSIFSKEMLEHYQVNCGIKFNLTHLEEFRTTPGFLGLRRTPYNQPQDSQVSKMIAALDQISSSDPDVYLICWLGLTFGLRKSEVAPLTSDCFVRLDGEVYVEIRTVEGRGSLRDTTKNGQEVPRVKAANGGWSKIGPIVERIPRGRYLIGGSDTYRTDGVFRRVNDWLTSQGWRTQKKFHELRAFAGSRVIMNDGIEAASSWLRHGSISLTQAHYGRYAKSVVRDIPLKLQNPVEGVSNAAALDTPLDTPKWNTDRASEGLSKWNLSTISGGQQPDQTVEDKGFSYAIAYR